MGEVAEWIALNDVPNLGPRRIAAVFRETGGIDSFMAGDFARLADILHVKVETIRNILGALDLERGREMTPLPKQNWHRHPAMSRLSQPAPGNL